MTAFGAFVGINNHSQTITAAEIPTFDPNLIPYDLRPVRTLTETVHDTIRVEVPKVVTKYRKKEVKVPYRDTLNVVLHFCDCEEKLPVVEKDSL